MADSDMVNHPPHYQSGGMEVIDVIERYYLGFHLGNAVKYILRAGKKGTPEDRVTDLQKALWYLRRFQDKEAILLPYSGYPDAQGHLDKVFDAFDLPYGLMRAISLILGDGNILAASDFVWVEIKKELGT